MANDSGEILVGANGTVWVAETTDAPPTNIGTAMTAVDAGWTELGFLSEDGVTWTDGKTVEGIPVWQSFYDARRIVTARESMVAFVLRQWDAVTIPFAFGGGEITGGGATAEVEAVTLESFGGVDTFKLTWNAVESTTTVTRGTNNTAAGIKAVIEGIAGFTADVTVSNVTDGGFLVTWNDPGTVASVLSVTSGTGGVTGDVTVLTAGSNAAGAEYVYTPPEPEELDERSLTVEWQDGDKDYRLYFPRGMVTEAIESKLSRGAAADLPITFAALSDGTDPVFQLFTNDPSFA